MEERLEEIGQSEGIRYDLVDYDSLEQNYADYDAGKIDGFLQERMIKDRQDEIAATLYAMPTHLAVKKGNKELLQRLDAAIAAIELVNPYWNISLFDKYFHRQLQQPLVLTHEEREYLKEKGKLVVFASPGQPPYTYFENGNHHGIIEAILQTMAQDLGIEIEVRETGTNDEMMELMTNGQADAIADFFSDFNWAKEHNARLSFPYLELNYVAVIRRGAVLPDTPRVACPRSHFYTYRFLEKMFPAEQRIYYDTPEQCLAAVSFGQADITYTKAVTAQRDIWNGGFYDLVTNGNVVFSHSVAMAVSDQADPMLLRILNKEISHLNPDEIQGIMNRELFSTKEEGSLRSYVYRYPMQFLLGVLLLAGLIIGGLLYMMYMRRRYMHRMREMAYMDPSMGLHNLNWFVDVVPRMIEKERQARAEGRLFIVAYSVERRELLNNSFGRKAVLAERRRQVLQAEREEPWLQAVAVMEANACGFCCVRPGEDIARLLCASLENRSLVPLGSMQIRVNIKAGICQVPPNREADIHALMDAAFAASTELFGRREKVGFYNEGHRQENERQARLEALMEKALTAREFQVWLQSKYDIRTQRVSGAEALVRWQSPEMGFLMPGQFIDLFERCGFIVEFDYYMLETVCQLQRQRLDAGLPIVTISVNQSRLHMQEEGYVERMKQIMEQYRLPHEAVELELTETAFTELREKKQDVLKVVLALQSMGFALSMDDFGTGYSSLELLQQIPMDVMKLDRSLLLAAEKDLRAEMILESMIQLGNRLQMQVLCEGIETKEQEQLLLGHGCCFGQGFLYGKPMPAADFGAFLTSHGGRAADEDSVLY